MKCLHCFYLSNRLLLLFQIRCRSHQNRCHHDERCRRQSDSNPRLLLYFATDRQRRTTTGSREILASINQQISDFNKTGTILNAFLWSVLSSVCSLGVGAGMYVEPHRGIQRTNCKDNFVNSLLFEPTCTPLFVKTGTILTAFCGLCWVRFTQRITIHLVWDTTSFCEYLSTIWCFLSQPNKYQLSKEIMRIFRWTCYTMTATVVVLP